MHIMKYINGQVEAYRVIILLPVCFLKANSVVTFLGRFPDSSPFYHEEHKDGLVKICRMALYQKYPKYPVEGFEALYSRPPVIYISSAAMPGLSNYLCLQVNICTNHTVIYMLFQQDFCNLP